MQEIGYGLYEKALKQFDRKRFDSGKSEINHFLSSLAGQHEKRGLSKTFILAGKLSEIGSKHEVAGYFTLAPTTVVKQGLAGLVSGLPNGSIPVTMISRLGVDLRYQGQGIGTELVASALMLSADLNDKGLPTVGVVLDVLDKEAAQFYDKLAIFKSLPGTADKRFISMKACKALRAGAHGTSET